MESTPFEFQSDCQPDRSEVLKIVSMSTEHLTDFRGQLLQGKGFLDEIDTLVQYTLMRNDIGCISGHVEAFDARTR